jgi:hypothetical protein
MKSRILLQGLGVLLTGTLLAGAAAGGTVQSGPPVDAKVPGPFRPLNVTGPDAGKNVCLYCKNGPRPMVMIFAREVSPAVVALMQKIDAATAAHSDCRMSSCAIFCNEAAGLPGQLQDVAQKAGLKHIVLATYAAGGPPAYHIAAEADVTVLLYTHFTVKANHAFKKGTLTGPDIDKVVGDVAKILHGDD